MADAHASFVDLSRLDRETLEALVVAQQEKLLSRNSEIEHLKLIIAKLRRMMFGTKSEKIAREVEQLELKLEELETSEAARSPAAAPASSTVRRKRKRRPLPEHLPRETHTHMPAEEACSACGGELCKLGEDVSEMLEYIPASFKVIRHVRPKMCCTHCDLIVQAPAPSRPIDRGLAGPGLLWPMFWCPSMQIIFPCIASRRSTPAKALTWIARRSPTGSELPAILLSPLVDQLRKHVLAAAKLHADDTPVPVLAPGTGKTKIARLWTYVRDDRPAGSDVPPAVWFAYSQDRKGEHPKQHLNLFAGVLQADGYAGFHHLYEGGRIVEAACWAHVRRKFYDIHVAHGSAIAGEAIQWIGKLYDIEREIRGQAAKLRCEIRQTRARPVMDDLYRWFHKTLVGLSRKSDTAAAIRYALSRWRALGRFLDDGSIEIDNSAAERALRVVALGRKNYLFAGSDEGGSYCPSRYLLIN
jgi:transposase